MSNTKDTSLKIEGPSIITQPDTSFGMKYSIEFTVSNSNSVLLPVSEGKQFRSVSFNLGPKNEYSAIIVLFWRGCCLKSCGAKGYAKACVHITYTSNIKGNPILNGKAKICFSNIGYPNSTSCDIHESNESCGSLGICARGLDVEKIVNKDGYLSITCELTLNANVVLPTIENPLPQKSAVAHCKLKEDLGYLLRNNDLTDVTLTAEGKEFKAHKAILAARSPVFKKMFQTEMSENRSNVVEISDMDSESLQSLVSYLYTDEVPNVEELGEALLAAAEKYQLEGLKAKCEEALGKKLTVENAARIFLLADLHRADDLKNHVVAFIKDNHNRDKVFETEEWKVVKQEHPLSVVMAFL